MLPMPSLAFLFCLPTNSSNVYAVTRNIEEPASAKMTPIMPMAEDSNQEVVSKGPTVVSPESDEVQPQPFRDWCWR